MADPFFLKTYKEERQWLVDETARRANPLIPRNDPRLKADYTTQAGKLKRQQGTIATWNQKIRCLSFDLPALKTCPGARASLDSTKAGGMGICTLCYASKGPCEFENVKTTMGMRLRVSRSKDFVDTMIHILEKRDPRYIAGDYSQERDNPGYFRVHSSGDLYSADYVRKWTNICHHFRGKIKFWFPTRFWAAPTALMNSLAYPLGQLSQLSNVILRPSMLQFNEYPERLVSSDINWAAPTGALIFKDLEVQKRIGKGMAVFKSDPSLEQEWQGVWFCPATPRDHDGKTIATTWNCDVQKCRHCWNHPEIPVVYRVH
jgi:hypothetical protein